MATVWDEVRKDFPALEKHVHLNAAATSPTPRPVREAVDAWYRDVEEGGDLGWERWLERQEEVRARVAAFVNAEPDEIAFVPNTSTGVNMIADLVGPDGPVLSDEIEFPAVTLPWIHRGIPVHFVPAVEGVLRIESFENPNAGRAATIAISHVQFSNGCRQDLEAFGRVKEDRHLVVSASQSAGAFPIDVKAMALDGLATAGHKWLCAGYGAGFVYIRRGLFEKRKPRAIGWMSVEDPFTFDNRQYRLLPAARAEELGTPPFAMVFALGAAVDYLRGIGIEAISERVLELNRYLTSQLIRVGVPVLSPGGAYRSGETLAAVDDPSKAAAFLRSRGILVTRKPEGLRISTHCYNSESDVDTCVRAMVDYLRLS